MLCPTCRRQVGKDGYCPEGHLARPDRALQQPVSAPPRVPPPSPHPMPSGPPPVPSDPGVPVGPMKLNRRPVVMAMVFVVLIVGVLGFMAFGPSASAANLKYAFAPGEVHTYRLTMTFDLKATMIRLGAVAFNGAMETTMTQRTLAVGKNGEATIQIEMGKIRFTEGSTVVDIPAPGTVVTIKMAPDGSVREADGKGVLSFAASNPMASFAEMALPESVGPLLPDHKVDPGQSWSIDENMANPFGETIHFEGQAKLLERTTIEGEEVAVIRSVMNMPFNIDAGVQELARYAGEEAPSNMRGARMTFNGFLGGDLTQALTTKSGFLKSAIGDITMTGTLGFISLPGIGDVEAILNATIRLTMTEIPQAEGLAHVHDVAGGDLL